MTGQEPGNMDSTTPPESGVAAPYGEADPESTVDVDAFPEGVAEATLAGAVAAGADDIGSAVDTAAAQPNRDRTTGESIGDWDWAGPRISEKTGKKVQRSW